MVVPFLCGIPHPTGLYVGRLFCHDYSKKALDRKPFTSERYTHSEEYTYMLNELMECINSNLEKCKQKNKDVMV